VKWNVLIPQRFLRSRIYGFPGAKLSKVLRRLRHDVCKQFHFYSSNFGAPDGDIEEYDGIRFNNRSIVPRCRRFYRRIFRGHVLMCARVCARVCVSDSLLRALFERGEKREKREKQREKREKQREKREKREKKSKKRAQLPIIKEINEGLSSFVSLSLSSISSQHFLLKSTFFLSANAERERETH
jgi:hypothetical protein